MPLVSMCDGSKYFFKCSVYELAEIAEWRGQRLSDSCEKGRKKYNPIGLSLKRHHRIYPRESNTNLL